MSKPVLCTYKNLSRLFAAMLMGGLSLSGYAALPYVEDEPEAFKEATFVWPTPPNGNTKPARYELQAYEVPRPSSGVYEIDLASLTLGSDDVIRMVLVHTSPSGVKNISFEGVRCQTEERKLYGFVRSDGTWNELTNARWQPLKSFASAKHVVTLARDFFCFGPTVRGTEGEIKARLHEGGERSR